MATKLGARPRRPGTSFEDAAGLASVEGLSARAIPASALRSRDSLATERIDLLYAHIDDPSTKLRETVAAFAHLIDDGTIGPSRLARSQRRPAMKYCNTTSAICGRGPIFRDAGRRMASRG